MCINIHNMYDETKKKVIGYIFVSIVALFTITSASLTEVSFLTIVSCIGRPAVSGRKKHATLAKRQSKLKMVYGMRTWIRA